MKNSTILILVSILYGVLCTSKIDYGKIDSSIIFNDISTDKSLIINLNNIESYPDHLKILSTDYKNYVVIGGRDKAYNICTTTGDILSSYTWISSKKDQDECIMKGRNDEECHNYIRVLSPESSTNRTLICGTNSFKPKCRLIDGIMREEAGNIFQFSGIGIVPYDPSFESTFIRDGDELYTSSVTDFDSMDPLIYRKNVTISNQSDLGIRTVKDDERFLNSPHFVGSFMYGEYVYYWLREEATECDNCDPIIYSRVVRMCRSDRGGPRRYSNEWTSFVKARLNCSISGRYPFYFDQIESISFVKETKLIYATFTSSLAGIAQSAVCGYDLNMIDKIFSNSLFMGQLSQGNVWRYKKESNINYKPGSCIKNSKELSENEVAYAKRNTLAKDVVPNKFTTAQVTTLGPGEDRYMAIAVKHDKADILYVGTDNGIIKKMIVKNINGENVIENVMEIKISSKQIKDLLIVKDNLIVMEDNTIKKVNIDFCLTFSHSCSKCLIKNSGCIWDSNENICFDKNKSKTNNLTVIINKESCPDFLLTTTEESLTNFIPNTLLDIQKDGNIASIKEEKEYIKRSGFFSNEYAFIIIIIFISLLVIIGFLLVIIILRKRDHSDGDKSEKSLSIATSSLSNDSTRSSEYIKRTTPSGIHDIIDAYDTNPYGKVVNIRPIMTATPFIPPQSTDSTIRDSITPRHSANNDEIALQIDGHSTLLRTSRSQHYPPIGDTNLLYKNSYITHLDGLSSSIDNSYHPSTLKNNNYYNN
ncbi:Sema domain and WD40/YVTN repeat-like-containing domain-containing protein [Strongyloides ratti]|uniref:Sema domain and WD40/YVTN repeat-like-containing domain-containing protein n=1 Tax=Strongyloides ratti TaxID=34506 RepID=A0A090LEH5_STRRB|nr:Sema domain and WD40/YVTN repeat-like-containing domain-containing protein [Strongyloides ratti]CEF66548.1 Sema domain and WD40/YVTN repeat-like-containing domain-containing protein [Strongyloides ratti]